MKNATQAAARAARYLADLDEEDDAIECSVQVPDWLVHAFVAGNRVEFKNTYMPGYADDYVWLRVAKVTTRQVQGPDGTAFGWYKLGLDLRAETPPGPAAPGWVYEDMAPGGEEPWAIEWRPHIEDTTGAVEFQSDGDDTVPGDLSRPIPDGLEYLGTPFNRLGFGVTDHLRVDIEYIQRCSLASFNDTRLTSKVYLSGAEIGNDVHTVPSTDPAFRIHETIITLTDVELSPGDTITVTSQFENPTGTPRHAGCQRRRHRVAEAVQHREPGARMRPTREMGNRALLTRGMGTTIEGTPGALDDLTDVDVTSTPPADGNALVWDAYIGEWVPGAAASALTVEDGTTSVSPVDTIVFDGATVTDDTGGQVTVAITGGGGGGGGVHELDYVQITSAASITASVEASANTVVTGSAVTYDGSTSIVVEFYAPVITPNAGAAENINIWLFDGSSSIGLMGQFTAATSATYRDPVHMTRRLTPSAAAHTYSIRATVTAGGTGTVQAGAGGSGAYMPAFIRITRATSGGTYTAWTPTLTADGGNPNLGTTGTATGRYTQHGKTVHAYGRIAFGGTGVTAGSGEYEIALPVAASTDAFPPQATVYGTAVLFDNSATTFQVAAVYGLDANECRIALNKVGAPLTASNVAPWTWAASDQIILNLTYEAA